MPPTLLLPIYDAVDCWGLLFTVPVAGPSSTMRVNVSASCSSWCWATRALQTEACQRTPRSRPRPPARFMFHKNKLVIGGTNVIRTSAWAYWGHCMNGVTTHRDKHLLRAAV